MLDRRKSHIAWFEHNDWIAGLCHHYATLANKQAWKFDIDGMDGCQFTEYGIDEFYETHMDTHKLCDGMRKVVVWLCNSTQEKTMRAVSFFLWMEMKDMNLIILLTAVPLLCFLAFYIIKSNQ